MKHSIIGGRRHRIAMAYGAVGVLTWAGLGLGTSAADAAKPKRLLPHDNDFIQPPSSSLRPQAESRSAFSGSGFNVMDPGGSYLYRNQRSYTLRLVSNGQGSVETMRLAAESAASQVGAAAGTTVTVAAGTISDTTPDLEPLHGEILVSIDASSPCTGSWAGCGGPRSVDQHNADMSAIVRSGRVWIHPDAIGYTTAQKNHLVAHEIGHALGLAHYTEKPPGTPSGACPIQAGDYYGGQLQVMHWCSYDAASYRSGDNNGFDHLLVKPLGRFGSPQAATGWALQDPDSYSRWVYYRGTDGTLRETRYTGTAWASSVIGGAVSVGSVPAGLADATTGRRAVFFRGTNGMLWWARHANGSWTTEEIGWTVAAGTSPSVVGDPATGRYAVFYQDDTGQLRTTYNPGTGWAGALLGGAMAPNTSPSAVGDINAPGRFNVFYQGSDNQLRVTYNPGTGWAGALLGGAMAPGTSPSAIGDVNAPGKFSVFYHGSDGQLRRTWNPGTGWAGELLGGAMAPGTSPSAIGDVSDNFWEAAVYYQGNDGQLRTTYNPLGTGWGGAALGGAMASGANPSAVGNVANGLLAVFYKGSSGELHQTHHPGTGWTGGSLGVPMG